MEYTQAIQGNICEISISGKFTFADRQVFRAFFDIIKSKEINKFIIDIKGIEFVDSAALGILLLARDEAEKNNTQLTLRSPQDQVKKMFEISRFYELFNIEE